MVPIALRIKAKSLHAESGMIAKEERRRRHPRLIPQNAVEYRTADQGGNPENFDRTAKALDKPPHKIPIPAADAPPAIWRLYRKRVRAKYHSVETRISLHNHRVNVVRPALRAAHLASIYLAGRPYSHAELASSRWNIKGGLPAMIAAIRHNIMHFGYELLAPEFRRSAGLSERLYAQVAGWITYGEAPRLARPKEMLSADPLPQLSEIAPPPLALPG